MAISMTIWSGLDRTSPKGPEHQTNREHLEFIIILLWFWRSAADAAASTYIRLFVMMAVAPDSFKRAPTAIRGELQPGLLIDIARWRNESAHLMMVAIPKSLKCRASYTTCYSLHVVSSCGETHDLHICTIHPKRQQFLLKIFWFNIVSDTADPLPLMQPWPADPFLPRDWTTLHLLGFRPAAPWSFTKRLRQLMARAGSRWRSGDCQDKHFSERPEERSIKTAWIKMDSMKHMSQVTMTSAAFSSPGFLLKHGADLKTHDLEYEWIWF